MSAQDTIIDPTCVQLTNKPHFTSKTLLVVWNYFNHYFGLGLLFQTSMTIAFSCNLMMVTTFMSVRQSPNL